METLDVISCLPWPPAALPDNKVCLDPAAGPPERDHVRSRLAEAIRRLTHLGCHYSVVSRHARRHLGKREPRITQGFLSS